jgi:chemotaxis signal transduction protein
LAEGGYAVDSRAVRRVQTAPAETGATVLLDGRPWPVVPLRSLFGLPPAAGGHLVLVADADGRRGALATDGVLALARLGEGDLVPLPAVYTGPERRWFAALGRLDGRVVVILDVGGVLAAAGAPFDPDR